MISQTMLISILINCNIYSDMVYSSCSQSAGTYKSYSNCSDGCQNCNQKYEYPLGQCVSDYYLCTCTDTIPSCDKTHPVVYQFSNAEDCASKQNIRSVTVISPNACLVCEYFIYSTNNLTSYDFTSTCSCKSTNSRAVIYISRIINKILVLQWCCI
jgi:hypothetical protein